MQIAFAHLHICTFAQNCLKNLQDKRKNTIFAH